MGLNNIYIVAANDCDQVPEIADIEASLGVDKDGLNAVLAQSVANPPRAPDGGNGLKMFVVHTSN